MILFLFIISLTGKRPDNIEHLEEKLMADFDKLTEQYDLLFKDIERKKFYKYPICFISIITKTWLQL